MKSTFVPDVFVKRSLVVSDGMLSGHNVIHLTVLVNVSFPGGNGGSYCRVVAT